MSVEASKEREQQAVKLGLLLLIFVLVWVVSHGISDTNLDPYGDMLENYAWGQDFAFGNSKHPPLVGWITAIWFMVFPNHDLSYHLLAYTTVAFGLFGVFRLGAALGLGKQALAASLLLTLATPFSTLAIKFNANSILVALWPWVVFAWVNSLRLAGHKGFLWSLLFGVISALAVLGKYYSGVLLMSLLVTSLVTVVGRHWLFSYKPWLALISFSILLAPHLNWLWHNQFATLHYVAAQGDGHIDLKQVVKFAFAPLIFWLVPWLLVPWVSGISRRIDRLTAPEQAWRFVLRWIKSMALAWRYEGREDLLFFIVLLPWLISLGFGLSGFVTLSLPWAMPIGFGFSLLWLRNLSADEGCADRAKKVFWIWLLLVLLVSPIYAWQQSMKGEPNYYLPRHEAASVILSRWQEKYPGKSLDWISGPWPEYALLAFYGDPDLKILPESVDFSRVSGNGILVCPIGYLKSIDKTGEQKNSNRRNIGIAACKASLQSVPEDSFAVDGIVDLILHREGFRFALERPYQYQIVYLIPNK